MKTEIMDFVSQDSFWSNQSSLKEQVLLAAASNANLVTFTAKVALPVEELARFLRATTSVQEFNLDWRCYKDLCESTAATSPIAEAFVANQSIRQLSLKCKWEDFTLANQVLQRLDARNYFHCAVFIEVWHSYPNDLTLSSTTVLVSLQLVDMELDEDFVEQLSLNRSIERLELPGCSFLDAAAGAFVSFVQTRANQHGNRVRELRLNINNNPFPDMDVALDSAISAMIIGSALHSLELGNCTFLDSGSFFESLAADAKRICLQRLRVTSYVDYHPAIAQFLVKTTSLREFVIRLRDPNADALVRALQANCSLYTVSFVAEGTSILSSERQRLVEAYCERNQNLPELLQRLARPPVVLAMENAGSGTTRTIDEHSSNMRQFPPLFVAASPTPQTAAHNLVRGLLSMSEAFTRPDGVRSRADS
jgi:hypothetical protein